MDRDPRQQFRLVLLVMGWGLVGVNIAVQSWAGAMLLSLPMLWATWVYVKKHRNPE